MRPPAWVVTAWRERSPRERRLLVWGLAVLAPVAAYLYVWQPLMAAHARALQEVAQLRLQRDAMRLAAQEAARLRAQPPPAANLGERVRALAQRLGLAITINPGRVKGEDIVVRIEPVAVAAWVNYLAGLAQAGVRVTRCQAQIDSGLIQAELGLRGGG